MLRYKPWFDSHGDALGNYEDFPKGWVDAWAEFVSSPEGQLKVPSWQSVISDAQIFLDECDQELDDSQELGIDDDFCQTDRGEQSRYAVDDWMTCQRATDENNND